METRGELGGARRRLRDYLPGHGMRQLRAENARLQRELASWNDRWAQVERRLWFVLDNVSDVLFSISVENGERFRFTLVNRRFLEATGLREDQVVGATVDDIIPEPSRTLVLERYREAIRTGQRTEWEEVSVYPAGEKIGHVIVVPVRDAHGEYKQLIGLVHDVTERKHSETEVRRLNEALRRYADTLEQRVAERTEQLVIAREHAESADRLKSSFLASMSHELRTPLNSVIGFTSILLQGLAGPLNEEQSKQLQMVQSSAEHLLALINDVLDLSKIEVGQLKVAKERFDVRASIARVVGTISPLADKKGLALTTQVAGDVATLVSDQRRYEQILLNLLSNSVKFTDRGSVGVDVSVRDGRLQSTVTDTGIGIKQTDLAKLFKPFTEFEPGASKKHEGTGLGLSICQGLVEALGGSIWVRTEWGKGSTFGFDLPIDGTPS